MQKELNLFTRLFIIAGLAYEASACNSYTIPVTDILTREAAPTFDPTLKPDASETLTQITIPTQSPTLAPTLMPTLTPFLPPTAESTLSPTQTETLVPTMTLEQKFLLGQFNPSNPFTFEATPALMKALGFIFSDSVLKYKVNKIDKVETPFISDEIDKLFASTATDNKSGNPGAVVLTDEPNIKLILIHSMEPGAPGEFTRIVGSFLIKNPNKKDQILGQQVIITPDGGVPITATIADIINVSAEDFGDMDSENRFWGVFPDGNNVISFLTGNAGISENIRNDKTPGVYFFIMGSCTPENGDEWLDPLNLVHTNAELSNHNTANRTLLVLKFISP